MSGGRGFDSGKGERRDRGRSVEFASVKEAAQVGCDEKRAIEEG